MANGSGSDVEVKFGGNTADLDAASNKAVNDISKVGKSATGLSGVFSKAGAGFKSFTSSLTGGFADGWVSGIKNAQLSTESFNETIKDTASHVGPLGEIMSKFGAGMVALGAVAAVGAVVEWGKGFGDMAEHLDQVSAKLGMSAQEVTKWNSLAVTSGLNTDAFASSAQKLERAMVMAASGGKQQSAAFKALGVDINQTKDVSTTLLAISDKFSTMADGPKKTALAMATLGRSGASLIPILDAGSASLKEQFGIADGLGAVVSDKFMEAGRAVDEASDTMKLGMEGVQNTLFTELGPAIAATINMMNDMIKSFMDSYKAGGLVKTILDIIVFTFKAVVTAIATVSAGFQELWHIGVAALQGILGSIYTVGSALGKMLSGDFSGMKDAWVNGFKATGGAMKTEFDKSLQVGQTYRKQMQGLWGDSAPKSPKKPVGSDGDLAVAGLGGGGNKGPKGKTAEQLAAEKKRIAEQALKDQLEDLSYQQDMAKENYDVQMQLEQQKLDKLKGFYGEDSREYIKELRNKEKMERDHQQEIVRIAQQGIAARSQLDQTRAATANSLAELSLQAEQAHFDALDQMGQVSGKKRIETLKMFAEQELALQNQSENAIYEIKAQAIRDQLALANLPLEQKRALNIQLEQLEVDHQGKMATIAATGANAAAAINDKAAAQSLAKWQNMISPVSSALDGFLNSMESKSATFGQALLQMGDSILQSFISMGVKALAQWVTMELAKTSATTVGVTTRTGVEAAGAATSTSISALTAIKQIAHYAAVAAAGAYAAIASIPIVGPFLAPAAAAAALYGVYKLGQMVFSAKDGEGEVPYDGAQYTLHKKEMVLPAKFANPLRNMLATSPSMSGLGATAASQGAEARSEISNNTGGSPTFNYQPTHNNQDASLETLLRSDGATMRKWFRNEVRNNKFGILGEQS